MRKIKLLMVNNIMKRVCLLQSNEMIGNYIHVFFCWPSIFVYGGYHYHNQAIHRLSHYVFVLIIIKCSFDLSKKIIKTTTTRT